MKIDKSNPRHWIYLAVFTANTCLALLVRPWLKKRSGKIIILYGHKLNGNLKSLVDCNNQLPASKRLSMKFLTMDPAYYRSIQHEYPTLYGLNPKDMLDLSRASVLISDHGLHSLIIFLWLSNLKFVDVWHGIPFKGFDPDDFKVQRQYDEVWVTSEKLKQLYVDRFGFAANTVKITGYARTDILVQSKANSAQIKEKLGIKQLDKKIILFAPTWKQDKNHRSIYPFGLDEQNFLETINEICIKHNAICLLRKHLNSEASHTTAGNKEFEQIQHCSYQEFPDTEELLLVCDILVCDWSSIAFDYLLLKRPTIFLNVPPPFKKGFSLGPEYRFGEIVSDQKQMLKSLKHYLENPTDYQTRCRKKQDEITHMVYGHQSDGKSSVRCWQRLERMVKKN